MVFNSPDPNPNAYLRNHLFDFPTASGSRRAVAVASGDADRLISFYTLLVKSAIVQLWTIAVFVGVYFSLHRRPTHNTAAFSASILNSKRPVEVCQASFEYLRALKRRAPPHLLLWFIASALAVGASSAIPTLIVPFLVLGHGAPVNPAGIYVPSDRNITTEFTVRVSNLEVPAALRAAGSAQLSNSTTLESLVQIDDPIMVRDLGRGEYISRHGYRYNVTAKDFGLQRYHGLTLFVEGSCVTEYGWYNASDTSNQFVQDRYFLWGNASNDVIVSLYNGGMPLAYFQQKPPPVNSSFQLNASFAVVISSVGRSSYSRGTDPFYLTGAKPDKDGIYTVLNKRPVLSCWQTDTWSYKGQQFPVTSLKDHAGFPEALNTIFTRFLSIPKISSLGPRLGASALLSASAALGELFDASHANMHSDLARLVLASYIATSNTLTDTTLFTNDSNIPNLIADSQLQDVADFVIYGSHVTALSLAALAAIPLVWAVMQLIAYLVSTATWLPWHWVHALSASVLYSFLDERSFGTMSSSQNGEGGTHDDGAHGEHRWVRKSNAWFVGDARDLTCVTPRHQGKVLGFEETAAGEGSGALQNLGEKVMAPTTETPIHSVDLLG